MLPRLLIPHGQLKLGLQDPGTRKVPARHANGFMCLNGVYCTVSLHERYL